MMPPTGPMLDDLRAILARYPAWLRPIGIPEALGNAGGASGARLWRFESARGPIAARAWPPEGPDPAALGRIHGWLAEAAPLGFVPAPLPDLDGRTLQSAAGRLWELAPWLPGAPDPARPPAPGRLRAAFAGLAAFHLRLGRSRVEGSSPGLAARRAELEGLLAGGFEDLGLALAQSPDTPERADGLRWLDAARRVAPGLLAPAAKAAARPVPIQPCLRDARPDHFLFDGERLTGLVDFGAMGVESVAADLARLLAEWVGPDRPARTEALAAYAAVRPLDPAESALIPGFEQTAALLAGARWVRWSFVEGRTFDDPGAVAGGLARAVERVAALGAVAIRRP